MNPSPSSSGRRRSRGGSHRPLNGVPPLSVVRTRTPAAAAGQPHRSSNNNSALVKLSESCLQHRRKVHAGETMEPCALSLDTSPCRKELEILQTIVLPKVETQCDDIPQLCDFYCNAMIGCFCPHAVHLFLTPESIWPRIIALLQHLAAQVNPPASHISVTIARFLDRVRPDALEEFIAFVYGVTIACHLQHDDTIRLTLHGHTIQMESLRHAQTFQPILLNILLETLRLRQVHHMADLLPPHTELSGAALLKLGGILRYNIHCLWTPTCIEVLYILPDVDPLLLAQALTKQRHEKLYHRLERLTILDGPTIQVLNGLSDDSRIGKLLLRHGVPSDDTSGLISLCRHLRTTVPPRPRAAKRPRQDVSIPEIFLTAAVRHEIVDDQDIVERFEHCTDRTLVAVVLEACASFAHEDLQPAIQEFLDSVERPPELSPSILDTIWSIHFTLQQLPCVRTILGVPVYMDNSKAHVGAEASLRLGLVDSQSSDLHCMDILTKLQNCADHWESLVRTATDDADATIRYYLRGKLGSALAQQCVAHPQIVSQTLGALTNGSGGFARLFGSFLRSDAPFDMKQDVLKSLIHCWTDCSAGFQQRAAAFGELRRFFSLAAVEGSRLTPLLFHSVLLADTSERQSGGENNTEMRFELMMTLMEAMAESQSTQENENLIVRFEEAVPFIVKEAILYKDRIRLNRCASFRSYVMARLKVRLKSRKRTGQHSTDASRWIKACAPGSCVPRLPSMSRSWQREVDEQVKELCLTPNLMEGIVPLLLVYASPPEMKFFIEDVLQARISMKALLESRLVSILKSLVQQVGQDPTLRALMTSALGRIAYTMQNDSDMQVYVPGTGQGQPSRKMIVDVVTPHFMNLLVNVAQFRWASKSIRERSQALASLEFSLEFLSAAEANQYFPQVLASANSALSVELQKGEGVSLLWLTAIRMLDRYIRLSVESSWVTVGEHLTEIIVAFVPVLDETTSDVEIQECQLIATDLLQYLTGGELGKKLSAGFQKIPFIPRSSKLDAVRDSLRSLGVEVDELAALDLSKDTQQDVCLTSAVSEGGGCGSISSASVQQSLDRRLRVLCPLLGNDNVRVRRVVLMHLIATLKENRKTFQNIVFAEGGVSAKRFITEANVPSRGIIPEIIDTLLKRCIDESDHEVRLLLGGCFGEIGAIGPNKLADLNFEWKPPSSTPSTRNAKPWEAAHTPGFYIVTTHLVNALKAARSTIDQHKIAFAIQQILAILNIEMTDPSFDEDNTNAPDYKAAMTAKKANRQPMNAILSKKLHDGNVFEVVEPFYHSEFSEADTSHAPKLPPYFCQAATFFEWLSNWSRHMIRCCAQVKSDKWTALFHACRTALRSTDGIKLAEYLLPILISHQLCFGRGRDQESLYHEIVDVLRPDSDFVMPLPDRRKAVSVIFSTFFVLHNWTSSDQEIRPGNRDKSRKSAKNEWAKSEPELRIAGLLQKVPFNQRASAAASVDMHACSLQLFELSARTTAADQLLPSRNERLNKYDPTKSVLAGSFGSNNNLVKRSLLELGDLETLSQIDEDIRLQDKTFFIARKEASGDWQGALDEYERALQMCPQDDSLRLGNMRCSLEMGHFESVLQFSNGFDNIEGKDLATEACWRLGRWDQLNELSQKHGQQDEADREVESYQACVGHAMLKLHEKRYEELFCSTNKAKQYVMDDMSKAARESYGRAYKHIVKLQILQEIEEVGTILRTGQSPAQSISLDVQVNGWDQRLNLMSSDGAMAVVKTRIMLANLANDRRAEARLFLQLGQRARKQGLTNIAATALARADSVVRLETSKPIALFGKLQLETAKLKHWLGESSTALRFLDSDTGAESTVTTLEREDNQDEATVMKVRCALKVTKWMVEGGLKGCSDIMARFRHIHQAAPQFNKGHFEFAKFMDTVLQSRIATLQGHVHDDSTPIEDDDETRRSQIIASDSICQSYIILCIQHYAETLRIDVKLHRYVYQALPRLLSLWFDFSSVRPNSVFKKHLQRNPVWKALNNASQTQSATTSGGDATLAENQEEVNSIMGTYYRQIPAHAYYTAMPQILSRVSHPNADTAAIVSVLLRRLLIKYPAQSLWQIGWTRQSHIPERKTAGNAIFKEALASLNHKPSTKRHYKLLSTSHLLFEYLANLAAREAKEGGKTYRVKPLSQEVDLLEYIPPIQAALSISLLEGDSGRSRETFSRHIPRMRCFSSHVDVMASKAKPKKLKAFVVAAEDVSQYRKVGNTDPADGKFDMGTLHFLLKREAKGDLRKDARVQDLNNVVNRLLSVESDGKGSTGRRRISLRTFTVTCLSEDIGLIEWIPNTTALRSCIGKTRNPVVDEKRGYRSGERAVNFHQPDLHSWYNRAQDLFFKSGNLSEAASEFELLLRSYPPVLFWWFVQRFDDPHAWYEARQRFILSIAAWSAIGHVIGLGDRHSENIMIDQSSGECVHVDFDCILDKGLYLPKPEVVPFRLTQNIIDVFGPTGTDGMFAHCLGVSMNTLRKNRDTLLSVLEPFVKDPVINWKKSRTDAANRPDKDPVAAARQKMRVIECRLKGIYNLRNPNFRKYRRVDIPNGGQGNDELAHHSLPLSVEGQVQKLILEATKSENLVQIYYGWMPWV